MLVNLKKICSIAEEKGIAAGSFNITSQSGLHAVLDAAEEINVPVFIQYAPVHGCYISFEDILPAMMKYGEKASVPVCIHFDHGTDLELLEKALDLGAGGIMYDGSALPYEENLANTAKAVEMAKRYGAGVEAELGSMGGSESSGADRVYTDPDMAAEFVKATGIDALACSFGTQHGIYLKAPKLDLDIVRRVRENTDNIPVVMHGGSGVSKANLKKAVEAGVRKINYFTYMDMAGAASAKEFLEGNGQAQFSDMVLKAREGMKANALEAMKIFSGGKK